MKAMLSIGLTLISLSLVSAIADEHRLHGTIKDHKTGKPIPDVFVKARWQACVGFGHCSMVCRDMTVTKTDANGNYYIPTRNERFLDIVAYKPGYQTSGSSSYRGGVLPSTNISLVRLSKKDVDRRIWPLRQLVRGCDEDRSERNLAPLLRVIYDEVSGIAVTDKQKRFVQSVLDKLEAHEFGNSEFKEKNKARTASKRGY